MADTIEINIGTLDHDISDMKTEVGALRKEMELAYNAVGELDTMWNGPANDVFNRAFQSDKQAMDAMCNIIDSLIGYMENARNEYRRCEASVSSEIDAIRI